MIKTNTAFYGLLSGLLLLAAGSSTARATTLVTPAGLNQGDLFRFVFVTSATHDAVSGTISDYDSFVTGLAVAAGLDTYDGNAVSWQLLGSTRSVAAISRGS